MAFPINLSPGTTLLSRESRDLANELTATLELGYLARLARSSAMLTLETMYVLAQGFTSQLSLRRTVAILSPVTIST
ncbi:diguanylate cyclase [Salmonella enterica subsp. enterica serovar Madelia]|nr:diguanylate cyclase [Salmonella enterica subsp. enterica serovar Madelia]